MARPVNPKYPGIPTPTDDVAQHTKSLLILKESVEIGQRLRGDPLDSFVRLRELEELGLARTPGGGGPVVPSTSDSTKFWRGDKTWADTLTGPFTATIVTGTGFRASTDGTVGTPAFSFSSDPDTGMFRVTGNSVGIAVGGVENVRFDGQVRATDGVAGFPAYSFINDFDTGIYRVSANELGFSAGGTARVSLSTARLYCNLPLRVDPGSAAAPSFSFEADTDTGIFSVAPNSIGITVGGVENARFDGQFRTTDGVVGFPAHSFISDPDTGMYRSAINVLAFAAGGVNQLALTMSELILIVPLLGSDGTAAAPGYSFLNDANTGLFRAGPDIFGLSTGGIERARINSVGAFEIGTAIVEAVTGADPLLEIGGSTAFARMARNAAVVGGPNLVIAHSRHATIGAHTILQNNDEIGGIGFAASNGTVYENNVARIMAHVRGTPGALNNMPTSLSFFTAPVGSATSVERVRITPSGAVQFVGDFDAGFLLQAGVELGVSGGISYVQSFNRGTATYLPLRLAGSILSVLLNGTERLLVPGDAELLRLIGADAIGDCYHSYYDSNGLTRKGFIGYGGSVDDNMSVMNEKAAHLIFGTSALTRLIISADGVFRINNTHLLTGSPDVVLRLQHATANDAGLEFGRTSNTTMFIQAYDRQNSVSINLRYHALSHAFFNASGANIFEIESDNSWNVNGSNGVSGDYLASAGASASPAWTTPAWTNAQLADMAQSTVKGRAVGAGTGDPTDLTAAQTTAILDVFTGTLKGLAPLSGGGTANFLRADGTWAAPPGTGGFAPVFKVKTATTNRASTTTLTDDPHLFGWVLEPSASYIVTGGFTTSGNGGTTNGFQGQWDFNGQAANVTSYLGTALHGNSAANAVVGDINGYNFTFTASVNKFVQLLGAFVTNSSFTSGTLLDFQWAQVTSSVTSSSLLAGSWISVHRVA